LNRSLLPTLENSSLWQLPDYSRKVYFFNELASTMDTAFELAKGNCADGTIIVANHQTKGRGRMTRVWHSDTGGLYFTIILRPNISLEHSGRIGFTISYCLARTLRDDFGVDAKVKWPNDILVDEHKIAGILSQIHVEDDRIVFLNIGIGLNVNNDPTKLVPQATSLISLLNRRISRKEILSNFLKRLDQHMNDTDFLEKIIDYWKTLTVTLNRKVKIITSKKIYNGIARNVNASGALIIEREDGMLQTILYGDCFHQ
jgi:BirA family biotin operon repressor/biotin-[acetyl-CoA-carboxylase] ligase